MRWFQTKTLIATAGAIVLPLLALAYLASIPGPKSALLVILQVAIVVGGLFLFITFVGRLIEQMNTARVGRWLETDEGRAWLDGLSEEERTQFLSRLDPNG